MDLIVINGNSSADVSLGISSAVEAAIFRAGDFRVVTPSFGPSTVEGYLDGDLAAVAVIKEVAKWEPEADGFIIACFSDPGLYAAREITAKPVAGIAQSSMVTAVQLGHSFSILTPLQRLRPLIAGLVKKYGFSDHCVSIETIHISVAGVKENYERTVLDFIDAGRKAIERGAEVLILGGAVLAGMEATISRELGVPVLDPVKCAVVQLESLIHLSLSTSKICGFDFPREKECLDCPSELSTIYRQK
jgi:allantoin racemase